MIFRFCSGLGFRVCRFRVLGSGPHIGSIEPSSRVAESQATICLKMLPARRMGLGL